MSRIGATVLALAFLGSCYRTKFSLRDSTQVTLSEYDENWHHNGILGLVEFSDPVRLDRLCPTGVAEIEQRQSFLNGLVRVLTYSLYTPQTTTVLCDGASAAPAP